jgi:hypothetical protein
MDLAAPSSSRDGAACHMIFPERGGFTFWNLVVILKKGLTERSR